MQCYCEKMLGTLNRDGKGRDYERGIVMAQNHKVSKLFCFWEVSKMNRNFNKTFN